MPYVTLPQLIVQFGEDTLIQLTDRAGAGVIDEALINRALSSAEATVNGYLAARYPLPLSPVTEDVIDAVLAITRYNLDGDNGNQVVKDRYDTKIFWLKDVSAGRAALAGVSSPAPVSQASSRIEINSAQSVFNRAARGGGY